MGWAPVRLHTENTHTLNGWRHIKEPVLRREVMPAELYHRRSVDQHLTVKGTMCWNSGSNASLSRRDAEARFPLHKEICGRPFEAEKSQECSRAWSRRTRVAALERQRRDRIFGGVAGESRYQETKDEKELAGHVKCLILANDAPTAS